MRTNLTRILLLAACLIWSGRTLSSSPLSTDTLASRLTQAKHFKGLLDLPFPSFHYALSGISDSTAQTFVQYGLAEIYAHPDRAKRYSRKLQSFLREHPLGGTDQAETHNFADSYYYGSSLSNRHSPLLLASASRPYPGMSQSPKNGIERLVDLLPGSWIFSLLWHILSATCTGLVLVLAMVYWLARKEGTTFTISAIHPDATEHPAGDR